MRVLIIEDDPEDMSHICNVLTTNSHQTVQAKYGSTGLQYARQEQFDAIVLDRMLGNQDSEGQNGLDILHTLRKEGNKTPVLILSALGDVDQRVVGLHRGADDYLPKPFEISELLARLVAIVRSRNPMAVKEELVVEDLVMNLKARTVQRGKKINSPHCTSVSTPRSFNATFGRCCYKKNAYASGMAFGQLL